MTTPEMIAAGVEALRAGAGEDPAALVEAIYFAMRQATGEGRVLRRRT